MQPLSDDELARLVRETRAEVESLLANGAAGSAEEPASPRGAGEAGDGRVRAVAHQGRLESLELDPRAKRLSAEELGDQIKVAANAAFEDLLEKSPLATEVVPDLVLIAEQFDEVQAEIMHKVKSISQDVTEAMDDLRQYTSVSGDPAPYGLEQLLSLTQRNLDDAIKMTGMSEPLQGEGDGADGRIRVVAASGHIESVTIDGRALRMPSADLAHEAKSAINTALDNVRAGLSGGLRGGPDARVDLAKRIREVQDANVEFMDTYTRSLRDIMLSIDGPDGER